MKVRELIAALQEQDPDLDVAILYDGMEAPLGRVLDHTTQTWSNYPATPRQYRVERWLLLVQECDVVDGDETDRVDLQPQGRPT